MSIDPISYAAGRRTTSGSKQAVSWEAEVTFPFENLGVAGVVEYQVLTKCSNFAPSYEQLLGAELTLQGQSLTLSSENLLEREYPDGVKLTKVFIEDFGTQFVMVSVVNTGKTSLERGIYTREDLETFIPFITAHCRVDLSAFGRAIGVGNAEMEAGVTDLPDGVIYLQYE